MPSKNRSDKWDRTMKVSVNRRKEKSRNPSNLGGFGMVPVVGLEPTRCRQQRILSPPRLPIPTHRQEFSSKNTTPEIGGHFGGQTSKIKDIQFSKAQINRAVPASEREMTHWILSACPDSEDNGSKSPSADGAALEKVPRIRAFFAKSAKNIHRVCLCGFSAFFGEAANIGGRLEVDFRERRADR